MAIPIRNYPGGVTGAEAWYIVNHSQLSAGDYRNHASDYIKISQCGDAGSKILFNYNHSVDVPALCLTYNAPLESTTSRNVFFVSEVASTGVSYSHLTTEWNPILNGLPQVGPPIVNRFDNGSQASYVDNKGVTYTPSQPANINFYNWNVFQAGKKLKSYGSQGETSFYIGKEFYNGFLSATGLDFKGNFPEFISFPYELNANEKNRVESYLALKYGVTLDRAMSYKNARNTVFWNLTNNILFRYRTFGIGRDDISGLNQLQSESVHKKDYLIASVGELAEDNPQKQQQVSIDNNNFIVFGDNSESNALGATTNNFGVRMLTRKWLSQSTGGHAMDIPMYFKFNLAGNIQQELSQNSNLKLWMLHDEYVTNQQLSDFNSQYVNYYEPGSMDGLNYAFFDRIYFDTDSGTYDQFTFGVGPKMIVQVRFDNDCNDANVKSHVIITGGKASFTVSIKNNTTGQTQNYQTSSRDFAFTAVSPATYTVTVTDATGLVAATTVDTNFYPINVNLGPDIILNASQQQVTLNAGQYITDPNATYKWYRDGELLEQYAATLLVNEPGEYTVEVTGGNHICQGSDTILVYYKFTGNISPGFQCDKPKGYLTLNLSGGVGPFTTLISGPNQSLPQVHNQETYYFPEINFGTYTITSTDINGEVYQSGFTIADPLLGMEVDLLTQLQLSGVSISYNSLYPFPIANPVPNSTVTLDASLLVSNPNVSYEWFSNGQSLGIYGPVITLDTNVSLPSDLKEIKVVITNLNSGCSISDSFGIKGYWEVEAGSAQTAALEEELKQQRGVYDGSIRTKVYPNPSDASETFYYEVSSSEVFSGTVEILSPTGAVIEQVQISGESGYRLPFSLLTSGVYFICTKTNGILLTDKIIIR
ncbi:T9SS type A sorting domain-containing protein [Flavobacterium sp. ST-75]|uniref:T9SS type A sorting domain-containing protein n=1 Tax=Flavobacterium rhizophilum TaxID=3163296 RepID=A0ABW8Y986_9FLAO